MKFKLFVPFFVVGSLSVACAANTGPEGASQNQDIVQALQFGHHSAVAQATSAAPVEYSFQVKTAGAKADISVFATTTPKFGTYSDTVPPASLDLLGPGGKAVSGTPSDWDPKGGSTAITAYRRLIASDLPAGTYTIKYVPVVGEAYQVDLEGQDGKAAGSICKVAGANHWRDNPGCSAGLVCFTDTCGPPTPTGAGCSTADERNTHSVENDECAVGDYCKYSRAATQGDEGWNGYCARDDR